jgi:CheY-like chemotaxis protein
MLHTDVARFKQIMTNLISNAVKFTKKGSVEIGATLKSNKEIVFYVKDTGSGIEEKNLNKIFNRFWKSENEGDHFHSGTGLGLAISKSLCDALGASISVESACGKGSVFYVTLYDYFLKKESLTYGQGQIIPGMIDHHWENITIAIAEDESSNLYLLLSILKNLKVKIISFKNGSEIVEYIRNNMDKKIDLILMDLKMPVMDGYTATKLIREINREIPIVAQTAYAMVEDIEKIKASDFDDYLVKPIKPGTLVDKIKKLIFP